MPHQPRARARTAGARTLEEVAHEQRDEVRRGVAAHEHVRVDRAAGVPRRELHSRRVSTPLPTSEGGGTHRDGRQERDDGERGHAGRHDEHLMIPCVITDAVRRGGRGRTRRPVASPPGSATRVRTSCPLGSFAVVFDMGGGGLVVYGASSDGRGLPAQNKKRTENGKRKKSGICTGER